MLLTTRSLLGALGLSLFLAGSVGCATTVEGDADDGDADDGDADDGEGEGGGAEGSGGGDAEGSGGGVPEGCTCGALGAPLEGHCEEGDNSCWSEDCGDGVERYCMTEHPSGLPDCPDGELPIPAEDCFEHQGCHEVNVGGFSSFCAPVGSCGSARACYEPGAECTYEFDGCVEDWTCGADNVWEFGGATPDGCI